MARWKIVLLAIAGLLLIGGGLFYYFLQFADVDPYVPLFAEHCGDCHGDDLKGTNRGVALVDRYLEGGDNIAALMMSIRDRHPDSAFEAVLGEEKVKGLSIYVGERRLGQRFIDFRTRQEIVVPDEVLASEEHQFRLEVFADDLGPMPYSIAPLPDGSWLLTERESGLFVISPTGERSAPIEGTPETGDYTSHVRGLAAGLGWLLDVAVHPDYEENGWVYLHYTDLCHECENGNFIHPASLNQLARGRIVEGTWRDEEILWRADHRHYTNMPDTAAGGRIAFDDSGHVYISIGMKTPLALTSQDLDSPHGKIHRINDDGSIPADNPFVVEGGPEAPFEKHSIWTYGHRTPQGLEWHAERDRMWNAEMGPRGGDEINELQPGRNYGWPYHSLGLEYTMRKVQRHMINDVEFDEEDIEQTLVDFTPSPALSSFVFYDGDAFPAWRGNLLLATLKGGDLIRLVFDGTTLVHRETIVTDLARIRDIETGIDGLPYLLLENINGARIVKLVPVSGGR